MSFQLLLSLGLNLALSVAAGSAAKQWAATHIWWWLACGIGLNSIGFVALAYVIRTSGLGPGSSLALVATIAANTLAGIFFFNEQLSILQMLGISLSIPASALMIWG